MLSLLFPSFFETVKRDGLRILFIEGIVFGMLARSNVNIQEFLTIRDKLHDLEEIDRRLDQFVKRRNFSSRKSLLEIPVAFVKLQKEREREKRKVQSRLLFVLVYYKAVTSRGWIKGSREML